jgi:heme a synthase
MTAGKLYIKVWLWMGIILLSAMVIIGGITRLTKSGLSIVEWKPITGIVPPLTEEDWLLEFEQYKKFPEYKELNKGMSLREFKQIFFWEYLHRLLGRVIGIIFIVPFALFYRWGWISKSWVTPLLIIFLLGGLQGFMGWYMVKSGLDKIPHVSHFRLAAHQGMALLLIATLLWMVLSIDRNKKETKTISRKGLIAAVVSLALLMCQITLGAFVAGLKAGFSYTNFPLVGKTFFPSPHLIASSSFFYNGVVLQFIHRWLAFVVLVSFIWLFNAVKSHTRLRTKAKYLLMLGAIQITLGIITLLLNVPVIPGVAHQFTAIIILMVLIEIIHGLLYHYPSSSQIIERVGKAN